MSYCVATLSQRQTFSRRNHSTTPVVPLLICAIILFSILYIVQVNSITAAGYTIQKYKSEISALQSEHRNFELQTSEAQSLNLLEQKIKSLNMVKAEKIDYISPISEVAAK